MEEKEKVVGKVVGTIVGVKCPKCGSSNIKKSKGELVEKIGECVCMNCCYIWPCLKLCYITTATCLAAGKGDDCYELNMFRWFRDNWLINQPDGKELIEEYYETAPKIIDAINKRTNNSEIYENIWKDYLRPCLNLIKQGKFTEVKKLYMRMVKDLEKIFNQKI